MPRTPEKRLGRGLASIISTEFSSETVAIGSDRPNDPQASDVPRGTDAGSRFANIPIGLIRRNPAQPRKHFDEAGLAALAASIKDCGTLQPIVVRPAPGGYELVAGERRLRAAQIAGLTEIPATVRRVDDESLLELALIENLHRADLDPIERAQAYRVLQDRYGLTHDEIAKRVHEERATVSNYLRLLSLCDSVKDMVAAGLLTVGHAKSLASIADQQTQISIASRAAREGWSVRQLEAAAARMRAGRADAAQASSATARPVVRAMEEAFSNALGTRVSIREGRKRHSGRIVIEYYGLADFERVASKLGVDVTT